MEYRTKEVQVADFLREGIIAGRFPRGARLKQADIAKMLQLSITPVREALKVLEAEGYLLRSSYHGVTVSPFDSTASIEIVSLRVTLEGHLVNAALQRITSKEIEELQEIERQFEDAVRRLDRSEVRGINYRFHRFLYDKAQLPQTFHFVQILWAKYPFDLINYLEGRTQRAVEEHRVLLQQIIAGDLPGSLLAARRHIESGWTELQSAIKQGLPGPRYLDDPLDASTPQVSL